MNRQMMILIIAVLIVLLFFLIVVFFLMLLARNIRNKREKEKEIREYGAGEIEADIVNRKQALMDVIACDGINPNPYPYMVLNDTGVNVYVRCFTVESLPKTLKFATTFRPLINYRHIDTSIFIMPESEDKTRKKLDRHITVLDGEQSTAYKNKDRNRIRSLQGQISDTESWVSRIEEGYDKFFRVQFLFVMKSTSLKDLNVQSEDFYHIAKKASIGISATYACHPEAFISGAPYAMPLGGTKFNRGGGKVSVRLGNKVPLKFHYLSRGAVADLFHHVSSDFRHQSGVPLGRTFDMKPVLFDPFAETHMNGYGMIIAGKTGSGKTTAIKAMAKRLQNTTGRYRFAIIDSQKRGNRGEYSSLADDLNGVCHQLKHNSSFIINLCEVSDQLEYDEMLKTEYKALHLAERKSVISDNLMMIVQGNKADAEFSLNTYMERVLKDTIDECFDEMGIYDGQPETLYEMKEVLDDTGAFVEKKVKKELPTISMIYKKLLVKHHLSDRHEEAIGLILDSLKDYVRMIAYVEVDGDYHFIDEKQYVALEATGQKPMYQIGDKSYPITVIRGGKNYFDGQSTVEFNSDCACTNFDISGLPDGERPTARQVVMSFITEEFSKNNSMNFNSKTSDKLVVILDECHENYPFQFMRRSIDNAYRTQRKRHCSTWISQQALSDGSQYDEISQGVIANTAIMFLFKQPTSDKAFLAEHTPLNDRQIDDVVMIGMPKNLSEDPEEAKKEVKNHIGECCLIDGGKVTFMKFDVLVNSETELIASNKSTLDELYAQREGA